MSETEPPVADSGANPGVGPELTAFQWNVLTILAEESMYGLAVKRSLEEYYSDEVNHGRLYPNLDDLVAMGLVTKSELDKRTNEYALTQTGVETLAARFDWMLSKFITSDERAKRVSRLLSNHR